MSASVEFSRPFRLDTIGGEPRAVSIAAEEAERAALAARFGLPAIAELAADATLRRDGASVWAEGRLRARATQACVATGDPVPARIDEPFSLRFDPADQAAAPEEVELDAADLDILPYEGGAVDLGEAVAQGFALALDPFPRSSRAEERLREAGVLSEAEAEVARQEASPFAALKGLIKE
jgi:uncharacterized metal-binding protein YceD (DUF177 family)